MAGLATDRSQAVDLPTLISVLIPSVRTNRRRTVYIVVRRTHIHLADRLRTALQGRRDVRVVVDRRVADKRLRRRVSAEWRGAERRSRGAAAVDVVIDAMKAAP